MRYALPFIILCIAGVKIAEALIGVHKTPVAIEEGCNRVALNKEFVHRTTQTINENYNAFLSEDEVAEIVFIRCMGRMLNEKAEHKLNEYLIQNRQRS